MATEPKTRKIIQYLDSSPYVVWALLIGVTFFFTIILHPSLVTDRQVYNLGDVARRDVKALRDFFIVDTEATEENKKQAVESVLTVYDHDTSLAEFIIQGMGLAFSDLRAVYENNRNGNPSS